MASMLDKWLDRPLPDARILDVGCGTGDVLGWFYKRGASPKNLFGIDLVPERIEAARNASMWCWPLPCSLQSLIR
jgi:ubiquinone/menaquinone biosynthesis C-methylase UbiE